MNKCLSALFFIFNSLFAIAQNQFSGDLQLNSEFYQRDSAIGAYGTPHYDNLLSGIDAWLSVNYQNESQGLEAGIRLDVFNNSNLHTPGIPYTGQGIGRWYVSKKFDELKITGGYIYEQFGTGLTFRSYEERPLGLDNALFGLELTYNLNANWTVKAIAGKQKYLFTTYGPVIKGFNSDYVLNIKNKVQLTPGISFINRTIDQENMDLIASTINSYPLDEKFVPKYNLFAGSVYNALSWKNISWYFEYALKSHEAIKNAIGTLIDKPGNVFYTSLTYSTKGFGITANYRKVDNWVLRTSPNELLLNGILDFLPSLTKQNSLRLTARYQDVAQELGETAYQFNITYSPNKKNTITVNYSDAALPDQTQLFREIYADIEMRRIKYKLELGAQYVLYNQRILEKHPLDTIVEPVTPFTEFTYKFTKKKSLRIELQYQYNTRDYGSWLFGLAEFNIAPNWSFSASDMWNYDPLKTDKALHYPNISGVFTYKSQRYSLSYTKQIAGIVCTGGVCRYEPAFSGVKASIITTF